MPDRRTAFHEHVAKVEDDGRRASEALVRRLKGLTPAQFLRESPKIFDKLSLAQYREIVAAIAPDVVIPLPEEEPVEKPGFFERLAQFWRARTTWTQSLYATVAAALVISTLILTAGPLVSWEVAPITLRRTFDTSTWPECGRLAWNVDGCLYLTRHDFYWEWVAEQANFDSAQLRRLNPNLPDPYIPAGSQIIIWRGRGQLVRTDQ